MSVPLAGYPQVVHSLSRDVAGRPAEAFNGFEAMGAATMDKLNHFQRPAIISAPILIRFGEEVRRAAVAERKRAKRLREGPAVEGAMDGIPEVPQEPEKR